MDYFETDALNKFKQEFGNKKGVVTLSLWECDCSGHPYRPYGIVSHLVENGKMVSEIPAIDSLYSEVTTTEYNGETLPHLVVFHEVY